MKEIKLDAGCTVAVDAGPAKLYAELVVKDWNGQHAYPLPRQAALELHYQLGVLLASDWAR